MKKLLTIFSFSMIVMACNDGNGDTTLKDPSEVHPPSEAIPDSLQLVNDSVVVADTSGDPGVKANVVSSDTIQGNKQ